MVYKNWTGDKNNKRKVLMDMLKARWKTYCWPPASMYTNADSSTSKPGLKTVSTSAAPECVTVRSTNDDETDGLMSYLPYNFSELVHQMRLGAYPAPESTRVNKKRKAEYSLNEDPQIRKPWLMSPYLKKMRLPPSEDSDLNNQPVIEALAFYTQQGTNIDEMDHEDWEVDESDLESEIAEADASLTLATRPRRQEEPVTLLPPPPNLPTSDESWYIYASTIPKASIEAVTNRYTMTTQDTPWDAFVSTLHCGMFGLASNPSSDPQAIAIQLDTDDELSHWLQDVLKATDALMITNLDPSRGIIGGFAFSLPLAPLDPAQKLNDPVILLFSTDSTALQNSFKGSTPPDMGLRDGSTALMLGLDVSLQKSATVTLDTLARFVGLDSLFKNPFLSVLGSLNYVIPDSTNPGAGNRNAAWFIPQEAYATTVRLQLELAQSDIQTLGSFLSILNGKVISAYVIARRQSIWSSGSDSIAFETQGELVLVAHMTVAGLDFDVIIELSSEVVHIDLILKTKTSQVLDTMLGYLKSTIIGGDPLNDPFPFTGWLAQSTNSLSIPSFDFRRVKIAFVPAASDVSKLSFSSFSLDMELQFQAKAEIVMTLITFTYSTQSGAGPSLEADLWMAPPYDVKDPALRLLPDFENYAWFEPLDESKPLPRYLDLANLAGLDPSTSPPSIFPTALTMAKIYVDSSSFGIAATLRSISSQEHSKPPIFSIDEIDLAAAYRFGSNGDGGFDVSLALRAMIQPPPDRDIGPAELKGGFQYLGVEKQWTLLGSIDNLQAAHFYQFFSPEVQMAAASLLDTIAIKTFNVKYIYTTGQASNFTLGATLGIGSLDFILDYTNEGDPWKWDFLARVRFNSQLEQSSTLRDMLADVVGDDGINIPDFLGNIKVTMKSSEDEIGVRLVPDKDSKHIVFTLWVKYGNLRIQYIQSAPSSESVSKAVAPPIKRVFLTSIDGLPKVEVPLLGDLTQPFDEALAVWVQPQQGSDGLTLDEIGVINNVITKAPLDQKPLPYKSVKKEPAGTDTVLRNGVHLMLVLKDDKGKTNVALDYVFGDKKSDGSRLLADDDFPAENGESGMATYSKSYSGFSVRNLGLKYAGTILSIKVDASVKFGPIDFSLIGFAIHLDFPAGRDSSLFNLPKPSFSLDGLAAGYNAPPTTLAGMLLHVDDEKEKMYQGALAASFQPWAFSAAGCYGEIKGLDAYKTFFVYARLLGPLITLEFATISGVTAGFGYNNSMLFPTVADITSYPLISVPDPPPDAQSAIQQLTKSKWFSAKQGSFWIAAGLNVTAFEMLDVSAVVAVQWDPSVKLGIFAIGTAVIPPPTPGKKKVTFAQIQLGITAVVDFGAGTMKIDGQLTPASFILDPNCHLTGGFALYTWFGDSVPELKGDWVFTVGGYHRAFKPPPQYPNPPRLSISWQFDKAISIKGEAYFAITPKICMDGGRWDVSLQLGPLGAYYSAFVDFLISFKPFYFIADGGISVGVSFTMDLWLVTIHIKVDISATLHIEGPPIHGTVHVDFWVFGFDIDFGDSSSQTPSLKLPEFIALACQTSDSPARSMFHTLTKHTPVGSLARYKIQGAPSEKELEDEKIDTADALQPHVLVVQSGLVPQESTKTTPSGGDWTVRAATFSFAVSCKVAISQATIITGIPERSDAKDDPQVIVPGTANPIHARPMCITDLLTTELTVTITPDSVGKVTLEDGTIIDADVPVWDKNTAIVKSLPAGLWGQYDPKKDPRTHANDPSYLNGTKEGTVSLMCGVVISVPAPLLSTADTTKPFDYRKFMVQEIENRFTFPALRANEKRFLPTPPDRPPPKQPSKQWDYVRAAWENPGMGTQAPLDAVELWQQMGLSELGWDPEKVDPKKDRGLRGAMPVELVENLEDYYLWAPFLSAAEE